MPTKCAGKNCDKSCVCDKSDFLRLFDNNLPDCNKSSDEHPAMNASLINLVNLETKLAATRLLVEEYEAEIKTIKKDNGVLKSELTRFKKVDMNQKTKLKKLTQDNDNLRRELSKHGGIEKYTVETEPGSNSSVELTQIRDELTVTRAKLDSLRDHIKTLASHLLDLTSDITESANVHTESDRGVNQGGSNCDNEGTLINQVSSNDGFQVVGRGRRRGGHSESTQDGATNDETLPATQVPPTGEAAVTRPGTGVLVTNLLVRSDRWTSKTGSHTHQQYKSDYQTLW